MFAAPRFILAGQPGSSAPARFALIVDIRRKEI